MVGRVDKPRDSPEDVGELIVLDWNTKTVQARVIVDSGNLVEKGRSRGATGIDWFEEKIYVGCRSGIAKMNPDTYDYEILDIAAPAGMHQIKSRGNKLFMAGTGDNSLVTLENDEIVEKVCLRNPSKGTLHFNSIAWDSKGHQYHLYMGDRSSIRAIRRNPSQIINYTKGKKIHSHLGNLPHDLCFINGDRLLYTASADGEVRFLNLKTKERGIFFKTSLQSNPAGGYRVQGLLRGLAFDEPTNAVFVGAAPGIIYELDADTGEERDHMNFANSVGTAIYDILLDPRDWLCFGNPVDLEQFLEEAPGMLVLHKRSRRKRFIDWLERMIC
jgi:WD40 repeat protein